MSRIVASDEEIRHVKLQILSVLHKIAVCAEASHDICNLSDDKIELVYKALSYVSYDMELESLQALLNELTRNKKKN